MQDLANRPWVTAGVALTAASMVAVAPIAVPTLPEVHVPEIQLSSSFDPITPWLDVFSDAGDNIQHLFEAWASAPFPVYQQVAVNQIGYLETILNGGNIGAIPGKIGDNLLAALAAPFRPFDALLSADASAVGWSSSLPGLAGRTAIATAQAAARAILRGDVSHLSLFNFAQGATIDDSLLHTLINFSGSPLSGVLMGGLGSVLGPGKVLIDSIVSIYNDLTGGAPDLVGALNDLVNIPAYMTGAFLNGGQALDITGLAQSVELPPALAALIDINGASVELGGLLSPAGSIFNAIGANVSVLGGTVTIDLPGNDVGPIGTLIALPQAIAAAIGWDGTGMPLDIFAPGLIPGLGADLPMLLQNLVNIPNLLLAGLLGVF